MPEEPLDYVLRLNIAAYAGALRQVKEETEKVKQAFKSMVAEQIAGGKTGAVAFEETLAKLRAYIKLTDEAKQKQGGFGGAVRASGTAAKRAISEITSEMKNYSGEVDESAEKTSKFGKISQFVYGSILGITAVGAIRKIIDLLKQAFQAGLAWSQTVFTLELSVRALQRVGIDTTIKRFREEAERIKTLFPLFTTQEVQDAISQTALYTRELGFTEDQIFRVNEASVILAQVMGRDVAEASRMVAVALSSGYTEGLQRMGLAITKAQIEQRALEMGFTGSIQTMDTAEKAAATYAIIMEQVALLSEDAGKAQLTLAGRVRMSSARLQELNNLVGTLLLPALVALAEYLVTFAERGFKALQITLIKLNNLISPLVAQLIALAVASKQAGGLFKATAEDYEAALAVAEEIIDKKVLDINKFIIDPESGLSMLSDLEMAMMDFADTAEETAEITEESFAKIQKSIDDSNFKIMSDVKKENQDLIDDLEAIEQKGADKREDIKTKYYDKIADIGTKETDKIAAAERNLQAKLEKLDRDIARKQEDARQKARDKEEDREIKFQNALKKLREKFFFDLEESLRRNDIRGALRISRKFQKDKSNLASEEKEKRESIKKELQRELEDIEEYRKRKFAELQLENTRRTDEIRLQANRERDEAFLWRKREFRDLEEYLDRQRDLRHEKNRQVLRDIDTQSKQRIQKIINGLKAEYDVTAEFAKSLLELMESIYGSGGIYQQFAKNFPIPNIISPSPTPTVSPWTNPFKPRIIPPPPTTPSFAKGGSFVTNREMNIIVGEGGAERVDITPLAGRNSHSFSSSGVGGQIEVGISLDSGLVGKIIKQSQEGVVVTLNRIVRER